MTERKDKFVNKIQEKLLQYEQERKKCFSRFIKLEFFIFLIGCVLFFTGKYKKTGI